MFHKEEFPAMPEKMKTMVRQEVSRQMQLADGSERAPQDSSTYDGAEISYARRTAFVSDNTIGRFLNVKSETDYTDLHASGHHRRTSVRRVLAMAAAATLLIGASAFAATKMASLSSEREGKYGLNIALSEEDSLSALASDLEAVRKMSAGTSSLQEVPEFQVVFQYIPDGMIQPEEDPFKLFYEDTPWNGGISLHSVLMDESIDAGEIVQEREIIDSQLLTIAGHEAIYMEQANSGQGIGFDKKMYILCPEVSRVLEVFGGTDLSREEMIHIMEGMELATTGEMLSTANLETWRDIAHPQTEDDLEEPEILRVLREDAAYSVGESFVLPTAANDGNSLQWTEDVRVRVAQVEVADDLSFLERADMIPEEWTDVVDGDGHLTNVERQYIKYGDGIDSLDEIVDSQEVPLRLVYATLEFTNHGSEDLENILFFASLELMKKAGATWHDLQTPYAIDDWDLIAFPTVRIAGSMAYWDVTGEAAGNNGSNYIPRLAAGQTTNVHLAWLVPEDWTGNMYLDFGEGTVVDCQSRLAK